VRAGVSLSNGFGGRNLGSWRLDMVVALMGGDGGCRGDRRRLCPSESRSPRAASTSALALWLRIRRRFASCLLRLCKRDVVLRGDTLRARCQGALPPAPAVSGAGSLRWRARTELCATGLVELRWLAAGGGAFVLRRC
jgi:hypothetical protein